MKEIEKQVIFTLVNECMNRGYRVSIWDGGEWVLESSASKTRIMQNLGHSEEEVLRITEDGKLVGKVLLVYGNEPYYVISDHTSNPAMDELLAPVEALIEQLEVAHG